MAAPWHLHYDAGIRTTLAPYPHRTLLDYLADAVRERPDHPALIFKGRTLSWGELDRLGDAAAAALASLGVRKGDRVALILPNSPQFLIAEIGAWKVGAIVVPLNPMYTEHELQDALTQTGAEIVIALTPFVARVKACQPRTRVRRVIATNIKEYLPPLKQVLFTLFRERTGGHRIRLDPGDLWFGDLIRAHEGATRSSSHVRPDDPAIILMSGGTTGTPKGVVAPHRSYVIAGLQIREWVKSLCADWQDTLMLPLPLFHVYANVGVQSLAFVGHNALALIPNPREIDDVLDTIDAVRPSFFTGVPTLFIALCNHERVKSGQVSFTSIKVCFSGAAPLLADTKTRFEDLTGGRLVEGYSLTEAMMACLVNPLKGESKIGSVGLPLPDVEIAIVDAETGQTPLAQGQVGEIVLRAPQLMTSYWNNAEETAIALRPHGDGARWLHTGDLGRLDEDGYLFIVDRQKDLIKTSGYQVWPREIEEAIAAHPAVAEVGAGGVDDAVKGQVVWAWVVLRAGQTVTEQELRTHCRNILAPYKVPAHVEFRRDLPKTMVGKVLRRQLTAEARADARPGGAAHPSTGSG
jgi:long-chain acyl-CoA synthetase